MRIESGNNSTEAKFCKGFHPTFDSNSKFSHLLDLLTRYFLSGAHFTLLDEAYFKGGLVQQVSYYLENNSIPRNTGKAYYVSYREAKAL